MPDGITPSVEDVAVRELRIGLTGYVIRAAAGWELVVTSRGQPVARLTSLEPAEAPAGAEWHPPAERVPATAPVSDLVLEQRR